MKFRIALVLVLVVCVFMAAAVPAADLQAKPTGRYVIVFKTQPLPADAAARIRKAGGTPFRLLSPVGVATASGSPAFAAKIAKDTRVQVVGAETLYSAPEVKMAEAGPAVAGVASGAPTPADDLYYYQWDMRRIGAPAAWSRLPLSEITPRVAVLDTGVKDDHPDLAGQVILTKNTTYCPSLDFGAAYPAYSRYIDFDAYPDWAPGSPCTVAAVTTYHSHGTHVAGTIASSFGGGRVVGVAPDAKILAYKVFDRYRYTTSSGTLKDTVGAFDGPIFAAILDAVSEGAPVISMSLGSANVRNDTNGNATWLAWDRVAKYANRRGTLIVASAGNETLNANGTLFHIPSDLPTVMSTSATGTYDLAVSGGLYVVPPGYDYLASYSNYGSAVDISAPGGDCSPWYGCLSPFFILNAGIREVASATSPAGTNVYYFMAGTSMATPHVSAVAAWVRAMYPMWTPGMVRDYLKTTSENIGPRQWFGAGLVNADAATAVAP